MAGWGDVGGGGGGFNVSFSSVFFYLFPPTAKTGKQGLLNRRLEVIRMY